MSAAAVQTSSAAAQGATPSAARGAHASISRPRAEAAELVPAADGPAKSTSASEQSRVIATEQEAPRSIANPLPTGAPAKPADHHMSAEAVLSQDLHTAIRAAARPAGLEQPAEQGLRQPCAEGSADVPEPDQQWQVALHGANNSALQDRHDDSSRHIPNTMHAVPGSADAAGHQNSLPHVDGGMITSAPAETQQPISEHGNVQPSRSDEDTNRDADQQVEAEAGAGHASNEPAAVPNSERGNAQPLQPFRNDDDNTRDTTHQPEAEARPGWAGERLAAVPHLEQGDVQLMQPSGRDQDNNQDADDQPEAEADPRHGKELAAVPSPEQGNVPPMQPSGRDKDKTRDADHPPEAAAGPGAPGGEPAEAGPGHAGGEPAPGQHASGPEAAEGPAGQGSSQGQASVALLDGTLELTNAFIRAAAAQGQRARAKFGNLVLETI